MGVSKKIVLYSVILFMIVFNSVAITLIEYLNSKSLNNIISSALFQCDGIVAGLYLNSDKNEENIGNDFDTFIKSYLSFDNEGVANLEIYKDNKLIVSKNKVNYSGERPEIKETELYQKKFLIREVNKSKYLFVTQGLSISNKIYKVILSRNINYVYDEKIQIYKLFIILNILTIIILSFGMYLLAKKIIKPIKLLSDVSNEVASGDYSKRTNIETKDEVGVLSSNFNKMLNILEDKIRELNELNNSKQRFIDSLTHESKTPITSIIGYSDILLRRNLPEDMKNKALNYINLEAKRLESLNSTLLKLTLLNKQNIELEEANIKEIVIGAISALSYSLEIKNIKIDISISDYYTLCDKKLISILITNIIENAIKASNENSRIGLNSDEDDNGYALSIVDYGKGIPSEDLDKIKEPFYMVDKSRSGKSKGLGLGLSLCDEICNMFNIKLQIESKLNKGTNVTLTFSKER